MDRLRSVSIPAALAACALLAGCQSPTPARACPRQQEVHLSLANHSRVDTLAFATVAVDDSVVFDQPLRVNTSSGTTFQRVLRVCDGPHHVYARLGRYAQDTVLSFHHRTSLLVVMDYDTAFVGYNGIRLGTLNQEDPNIHAID